MQIPNAWMASTPKVTRVQFRLQAYTDADHYQQHPFWAAPFQIAFDPQTCPDGCSPEGLTGPVALHAAVGNWTQTWAPQNPSYQLHVLPPPLIYPFSWARPLAELQKSRCWARSTDFDRDACKAAFAADHPASITYVSAAGSSSPNFL